LPQEKKKKEIAHSPGTGNQCLPSKGCVKVVSHQEETRNLKDLKLLKFLLPLGQRGFDMKKSNGEIRSLARPSIPSLTHPMVSTMLSWKAVLYATC
jgi:hypothetical protein